MHRASQRTRQITLTALFAAVAAVLMYFEMPLPFMPPFLKLDLSSVPILIGSFLFGPLQAIIMAAIKAFVHLFSSTTGGVGELADFIITSAFAASAGLVYKYNRTQKGAFLGFVAGIAAIMAAGVLANKFLLIPFYSKIMPIDAIVAACNAVNPLIDSIDGYILFGVVPFNLIKGLVISLITLPFYKRLSRIIKRENPLPGDKTASRPS